MPFNKSVLKHACAEEFEQLYQALYAALQSHNDVLLLAPKGIGESCSALKAIQDQPDFEDEPPKIMVLLHDPHGVSEMLESSHKGQNSVVMQILPGIHTNKIIRQLSTSPNLVVGTPARVIDLLNKHYISVDQFDAILVEDVSSFMYLGYFEQLQQILDLASKTTKIVLTSALKNQQSLPLPLQHKFHLVDQMRLKYPFNFHAFTLISDEEKKKDTLFKLVCQLLPKTTMVFCSHRGDVIRLQKYLSLKNIACGMLHGGLTEEQHTLTHVLLKNGSIKVVITTDMTLHDADYEDIKYIVHYQMPLNSLAYANRNNVLLSQNHFGTAFHLIQEDEDQPDFIHTLPDVIELNKLKAEAPVSWWFTLQIKPVAKVSFQFSHVIRFLTSSGKLHRDEIGLVESHDGVYFIAVSANKADKTADLVDGLKIQGTAVKVKLITNLYEAE